MSTLAKRKNTRMVINPSRGGVLIGGRRVSSKATARKNPTARTAAKTNPRRRTRRRRNPATFSRSLFSNPSSSALVGAMFAGAGFSLLNLGLARVVPSASPVIQIAIKLGAGFLVQSFGSKVPVLGKYKDGVAFLCFALAAKEAVDMWVLPTVSRTIGQIGGGITNVLIPAPANVTEMSGLVRRTRPNYY